MATRTVLSPVPGETTPRITPESSRSQTQCSTGDLGNHGPLAQARGADSVISGSGVCISHRFSGLGHPLESQCPRGYYGNKHLAHTFPVPRSILSARAGSTSNWKVRNPRAARVQGAFQPPRSHLRAQTASHTHHHTPGEMIHVLQLANFPRRCSDWRPPSCHMQP